MRWWRFPLFLLLSVSATAQGRPLSVSVAGTGRFEAHTRQVVSAALICTNSSTQTRTVILETSLPKGWKMLGNGESFVLSPGPDSHIVSVLVPMDARAGVYTIDCVLRGADEDAAAAPAAAHAALEVVVLPDVKISLITLEQPPFTLAGQDYKVSFLLSNSGNADARVGLTVRSASGYSWTLSGVDTPDDLPVPAGGSIVLSFNVSTPATILSSTRSPLTLTVKDYGETQEKPLAVATSSVEVVPMSSGTGSLMHTLPVTSETSGRASFSDAGSAMIQETVRAHGSLDDAGEHTVDLLIQKQLATNLDPWQNPWDRYRAAYANSFMNVMIGDNQYDVSPLILMKQWGRGVGAGLKIGPVDASSFFYENIRDPALPLGLGGALQLTFPASGTESRFVYKAGLGVFSALADGALIGLYQRYNPFPGLKLQLDAALDIHAAADLSPAILAAAQGEAGPVIFDARFLRAWPGFHGEYQDTQQIGAGVGVHLLGDNLKLQGRVLFSDSNLLLDPTLQSAQRSLSVSLGATGTVPEWQTDASLQWMTNWKTDLLPVPDFSSLENRLFVSVHRPFGALDLRLSSMVGAASDELRESNTWTQNHGLEGSYAISDALALQAGVAYGRSRTNVQTPQNSARLSLGLSSTLPRTEASIGLGNEWSFSVSGLATVSLSLTGSLVHTFPWRHTLTAGGAFSLAYTGELWAPEGFLSLAYSVPLSVPTSRKPSAVSVQGTVIRAETKEPMPGVVLRLNGLASITDAQGRFSFAVPTAGTHYIQFDQRTLSKGLIAAQTMPYLVDSAPGSNANVTLGVVEGGSVSGIVTVYGYSESGALAEDSNPELKLQGGLAGIVVELSDGTEKLRRVTTSDGSFAFDEVRPGGWTLRIVAGRLPSYHTAEKEDVEVTVLPGEKRTVEMRVIQEQRKIQMVGVWQNPIIEVAAPAASKTIRLKENAPALQDTPASPQTEKPSAAPPGLDASQPAGAEPSPSVSPSSAAAGHAAAEPAGTPPAATGPAAVEPAPSHRADTAVNAAIGAARGTAAAALRAILDKAAAAARVRAARAAAIGAARSAAAAAARARAAKAAALAGAQSQVPGAETAATIKSPVPIPTPAPTPKPFIPAPAPTPKP